MNDENSGDSITVCGGKDPKYLDARGELRKIMPERKKIVIATRNFDLKCEICGTKKDVDLICGGPFSQLCKTCEPIVCKVIKKYLDMLGILPFRVVAGTVYQHHFKK